LKSFDDHFIQKGHWPTLVGVSLAWAMLDTAYYALLGPGSTTISSQIFNYLPLSYNCTSSACPPLENITDGPKPQSIYDGLIGITWRVMTILCAGSVFGGLVMIYLVKKNSPRRLQMIGFTILLFLFLVTGLILRFVQQPSTISGAVILYILASACFEIGPNFTTFMLPAELFPTNHRAFSHGIAAASGKLGAILFQIFIQRVRFHDGNGG
jgi:MFS transporter, PHS family, inorganic phosphate transporter